LAYKQLHCSHYNTPTLFLRFYQKIKRGQTFLTGKAINSEIIIDDIEVIVDNKGDSIFGEVTNIKRVTMKFFCSLDKPIRSKSLNIIDSLQLLQI
jgi:hypothetical protein